MPDTAALLAREDTTYPTYVWLALLYDARSRKVCWCGERKIGHRGWLRCAEQTARRLADDDCCCHLPGPPCGRCASGEHGGCVGGGSSA